jgi:hypothetical protein
MAILGCTLAITSHTPALAQLPHTWIASNGNDGANCDRPTPCATFSGAYGKTFVGGEITCADSGNYGGATVINHSITINCENAIGSKSQLGGVGPSTFTINAAAADVIILRGLDIDGLGLGGADSVRFTGAGTLHIQKLKINNVPTNSGVGGNGIQFIPVGPANLFVTDSHITDMGSSGTAAGINIKPASGVTANVTIERTVVNHNWFGIFADGTGGGTIRGVMTDCIVSGNINNGISINTSGANVGLMVENTKVSSNNYGLAVAGTGGLFLVRHSTITANNNGLAAFANGQAVSYRDNALNNNTVDGAFSFAISTQ